MLIASKVNGDTLSATEFNQITTEIQSNLITSSAQTPNAAILNQIAMAVASYVGQNNFCVDSGIANAYVLTQVSPFIRPVALKNGLTIKFRPGNNNSGACTANAYGFGVISIKEADGTTNPSAGRLSTAQDVELRYDGTVWRLTGASGATIIPVGSSIIWNTNTAPAGFLEENGAAISRTTFSGLFSVIGTTFGVGNGTTTFNLPDSRGYSPRGWDNGRGIDTGRAFGSNQQDAIQGHYHSARYGISGQQAGTGVEAQFVGNPFSTLVDGIGPAITDGANGTPRIASETRAINIAKMYCIKF